jgi:putative tricarboxylic transport membrane protein
MKNGQSSKGEGTGIFSRLSQLKGIFLIFFGALYFFILAGRGEEIQISGQLGPFFWPRTVLILLMISCGIKALEILPARQTRSESGRNDPLPAVNAVKLAALIALVLGAVAAMDILGFLLSNFLFLLSFLYLNGLRKKASLLLLASGGTVFLLYLFVKVVYLPLPRGLGVFGDATIFLYRLLGLI